MRAPRVPVRFEPGLSPPEVRSGARTLYLLKYGTDSFLHKEQMHIFTSPYFSPLGIKL